MNQNILLRSEVSIETTWNLDDLYMSREQWREQLTQVENQMNELVQYQGRLNHAPSLFECLQKYEKAYEELVKLGTYVSLKQSEDGSNPTSQEDSMYFGAIATQVETKLAFIQSEITDLTKDAYDALFPDLSIYKLFLDDIYNEKPHKLSIETEIALASLGELSDSPYRTYNVAKAADMKFEDFTLEDGTRHPNSFGLYETKYEYHPNHEIRKEAYKSFNKTLNQYKNIFASIYAAEVKKQVALSQVRHYHSVTDMLLEPHKVSEEMYHRQIDIIYQQLAPHMRKLARIKKEQLGLETISYFDLKAPLDFEFNPPASYHEIKQTIIDATSILGDEYAHIMKRAFDERWIDYANNAGKATGAFCASPYGSHSYILISYQDSMRSAFTLAHELGHAGHFTYANANQRIFDTRPSTFFVEAPSTMNEILLAHHLMEKDSNPRMKRWVILQLLGTYYHNFVTHLLEAEFQRRVYAHAEKGGSLTAKTLCSFKLDVIKTFWGDDVEVDEDAGLTWMRQPHYYMGLYPYTYSAGLTASTAIAKKIFTEGQPAIDQWIKTLKAGGTLPPEGLLQLSGLDISTAKPIESAVAYVGELINELESLFQLND